ncbi:MAG: hypothetical protein HYZ28_25775 [Myxococcales bacterium]|nr:hypothetical protein [Myxococcales bacterium]
MASTALALASLLALSQSPEAPLDAPLRQEPVPEPAPAEEAPPPRSLRPRLEPLADPLPVMRWDAPVMCGYLEPTRAVPSGHFRVQCDERTKLCLAAPTNVLGPDGVETPVPLSRARECTQLYREAWAAELRAGYRFVPAIADSPPGWVRDERGRVMQVNFDLNRRIYLGGAYAPSLSRQETTDRVRADFGIEVEFPSSTEPSVGRLHMLEAELLLGANSAIEGTLARYDWSVAREVPLLWITTFVGKPTRHDLTLDIAGWFEALRLESINRGGLRWQSFLTLGAANLTVDLWHSKDLVSYVRLRGGPALELDTRAGITAIKPVAAVEGDLTLDRDGFHHLRFSALGEKLLFEPEVAGRVRNPQRLKLRAGYELILLAINDYPLTLVADARGAWRDDLPGVLPGWELGAEAGLRFSFWAPARRSAPLQAAP